MRHLSLLPTTARLLAVFLVVTTASSAVICQETGKPPSESDLLFSTEYRRLQTFSVTGTRATADQTSLSTRVLF